MLSSASKSTVDVDSEAGHLGLVNVSPATRYGGFKGFAAVCRGQPGFANLLQRRFQTRSQSTALGLGLDG